MIVFDSLISWMPVSIPRKRKFVSREMVAPNEILDIRYNFF